MVRTGTSWVRSDLKALPKWLGMRDPVGRGWGWEGGPCCQDKGEEVRLRTEQGEGIPAARGIGGVKGRSRGGEGWSSEFLSTPGQTLCWVPLEAWIPSASDAKREQATPAPWE